MASAAHRMEKRMNMKTGKTKAWKAASLIVLATAALLTGCSGVPSNDEIKLAVAEKYSMSDVPKDLDCVLINTDKTGLGNKRWNFSCDATYEYGHRKIQIGAWHQDGKLAALVRD